MEKKTKTKTVDNDKRPVIIQIEYDSSKKEGETQLKMQGPGKVLFAKLVEIYCHACKEVLKTADATTAVMHKIYEEDDDENK